jgi:pimeloyl-ACP methyl ester carboxylesterase
MPDRRVQAAIDHWAPRFITMGVDYNEFVRTTGRIERWEDWLGAWSAVADEHLERAGAAEAAGRGRSAGEAYLHAALCLHFAKFVWVLDAAAHRRATERAIEALYHAHRHLDPSAERIEARLEGALLAANLRRPAGGATRPPLVILIPGLDSTKEEFFAWEDVFLARGMATLSLDGPGQGETGFSSSIEPAYESAVTAALDHLELNGELDGGRIGVAGVSLGGYYAARAAAYEKRIEAAVGISGPFDFGACWETMPRPTRETLMHATGATDEEEGRAKASELNLYAAAERIEQPFLAIAGRQDRLVPWEQTKRQADEAPGGEFVLFDEGSHVCNNIPYLYRPLAADWLAERLA